MIAVSIVDAKKKSVLSFFLLSFFPSVSINCKNFKNGFFDRMESNLGNVWRKTCIGYEIFSIRLLIIIIIATRLYPDVKNEWGDLLRWFRCYTIITSDSFYLFCKHGKNSPFLHRCVKTEFLFFSIPYRFLYVSNYNVQILQIDLRSTHSTGNSFVLQISLPPPFHQTRFICFYCEIAY